MLFKKSRYLAVAATSIISLNFSSLYADGQTQLEPDPQARGYATRALDGAASVYNAAASVGPSIYAKGSAVLHRKGRAIYESYADEIGEAGKRMFHAKLHRYGDRHVVDDHGNHIGYVEANSPQVIRRAARTFFGIDVEEAIPGVPAFLSRAAFNRLEAWVGNKLEDQAAHTISRLVQAGAQKAVRAGLNFAADEEVDAEEVSLDALTTTMLSEVQAELESELQGAGDSVQAQAFAELELNNRSVTKSVSEYIQGCLSAFKVWIADQIHGAVASTASRYVKMIVDQTDAWAMNTLETTVQATTTLAATIASGGTAGFVVGGLHALDTKLSDAQAPSYLGSFLSWVTGSEARRERVSSYAQHKASAVAHAAVDMLNLYTDEDLARVRANEGEEDEDGFTVVHTRPALPSLTNLCTDLAQRAAEIAADISGTVFDFVDAGEDLVDMMGGNGGDDLSDDEDFEDPTNPMPAIKAATGWLYSKVKFW